MPRKNTTNNITSPSASAGASGVPDSAGPTRGILKAPREVAIPAVPAPRRGRNRADEVKQVKTRYEAAGWTVIAGKGYNDLIARRDTKRSARLHFVRVVSDLAAPQGEFVQNAMSNGAEPVVVKVEKNKLTIINVNSGARVLLVTPSNDNAAPAPP